METVTIKKEILLERVRQNRDAHRKLIQKAREGHRARAILEFEEQLLRAKAGRRFKTDLRLIEPEDHTGDYDRLIEMLELSANDLIALRERDFRRYVQDDWDWKEEFQHSVARYLN